MVVLRDDPGRPPALHLGAGIRTGDPRRDEVDCSVADHRAGHFTRQRERQKANAGPPNERRHDRRLRACSHQSSPGLERPGPAQEAGRSFDVLVDNAEVALVVAVAAAAVVVVTAADAARVVVVVDVVLHFNSGIGLR